MDLKLFVSIFSLIFIAELPDKTALAGIVLATRHRPFAVFLGSSAAFLIQSAVAILFGSVIGLLPVHWVHFGAGILFLFFAVAMARSKPEVEEKALDENGESKFWKDTSLAFMTVFVAEWGDLTQLATATLAAKYRQHWTVFSAATLALWTVSAIGVAVGHHSRKVLHPNALKWVAVIAFTGVGLWLLFKS